jgi:Leucine-rich repeat (LRR) protein
MEVNVLQDLYMATGGDNWRWKSLFGFGEIWNFTDGSDPCNNRWQGVECTAARNGTAYDEWRITSLDLQGYKLRGTLPESLVNITELSSLVLAFNALQGTLPAFLGNMSALTLLDLAGNLLKGSIPETFHNLTRLSTLSLCANRLTGTIPAYIGEFTSLKTLGLCASSFTGTIPSSLGELRMLEVFNLQGNALHGNIPDSLSNLAHLHALYLFRNHLSGTIPDSLCELSPLTRILLYNNALTGTIPECVGALGNVTYFDVSNNDLHGSLPASLSDLNKLLYLWAHDNQLTGPIPADIGNCDALTEIYLSGNQLSQPLPDSFAFLTNLTSVYLQDNLLSGTLTYLFDDALLVQQVYLQDNLFSGPLPKPFPGLSNLTELFLQSNKFSGSLDGLFHSSVHHSLETVQLSDNHFTGPLPDEIFLLPRLETCAASYNCLTGAIPASICLNRALTTLILDGLKSAPICQERMFPGFSSYYVPQNHHGTLPHCLFEMRNLTTLHLAGNALSGPLPSKIPEDSLLSDLSISHNQLTGTISAALQTRPWTTLDLSFNRLVGGVDRDFGTQQPVNASVTYSLQNNRLSGKLPGTLDHIRNISVLGSNMFSCKVDKSDLPQHDGGIDTYSCGSDSFNYSYLTLIGLLACLVLGVGGVLSYAVFAGHAPRVEKALNTLSNWSVDANPDLRHFRRVCATSDILCLIGVLCTALILVVLMPWYVSVSFYYGTYTHMYAWVVSAAFLSGSTPAFVEMVLYMALMLFVSASSLYFVLQLDATQLRPPSVARSVAARPSVQTEAVLVSLPVRVAIYAAFLIINLTVVIGMNVAFVVMVLTQGNFVQFLAQVLVGAFKLMWNTVCTPYLINMCAKHITGTTYHDAAFTTLQVLIALMNNIAIPCLVVALISPSCFYSVFDPPPPVVSSFTYKTTARPGLGLAKREVFTYYATEQVSYSPSFAYDFQCTSSLITYYAPAFVYLAIGAALVSPAVSTALVQWHKRATPGTLLYRAVDYRLYRIWKPVNPDQPLPSHLFNANVHFVNLITYLGILLTFGVVFPPVAVAMCATMLSVNWQVKLAVGRFLHDAKKAQAFPLIALVEQDCKGAVSLVKLRRSVFLTIIFACSFLGLFLVDTYGDAEGLSESVPILVVMWIFPVLISILAWMRARLLGVTVAAVERRGRDAEGENVGMELREAAWIQQRGRDDAAPLGVEGGAREDEEVVNVLVGRL